MAATVADRPYLASALEERATVAPTVVVRERRSGVMSRGGNVRVGISMAWVGGEGCMRLRIRMMNDYVLGLRDIRDGGVWGKEGGVTLGHRNIRHCMKKFRRQQANGAHLLQDPHVEFHKGVKVEKALLHNIYKISCPFTTLSSQRHPPRSLIMNCLRIRRHRRLLKRLRQRRMRMARPRHVLTRRPILHR